jgi:hypothetical protein
MPDPLLAESRMGKNLADALRNDFFQYFHMRVAHSSPREHGSTLGYRPESDRFRDRVVVTVDVDNQGRFQSLRLAVDRSVVDDETSETSARDIVKSFLTDATPLADLQAVEDWINDIQLRPGMRGESLGREALSQEDLLDRLVTGLGEGKSISAWLGGGPRGSMPEAVTEAFEVFSGEAQVCERRLAHSTVRLENRKVEGKMTLLVSVSPQASGAKNAPS